MLDVFNEDAFGIVPLTDAISRIKFVPGRIGQMGLFSTSSIATTTAAIEERDGQLSLIAPSPRGGVGETADKLKRTLRSVAVPHFERYDAIMAEEVQGVRAFGSETSTEMVQSKVAERMSIHVDAFAATEEHARVGAVKGTVTYADSTTLNLFTLFGVSQESEVDFDLDNASPTSGALRKKCAGVVRQMAGILDGVAFSGIHAFCGDAFFDDLIAHPEVRETYTGWLAAQELRQGYVQGGLSYGAFPFGGIMWENYRGTVGGTAFVHTDKCHLFPLGVSGLFRTYYAPADYVETVNTNGQRLYSKQYAMPNGKGINLEMQMNSLNICTRPKTLIQGKRT
jgi:hypothetical protein